MRARWIAAAVCAAAAALAVLALLVCPGEERPPIAAGVIAGIVSWGAAERLIEGKTWQALLGASCVGALVYLSVADLTVTDRGRWWADHPMLGAALGGSLLLAVTILLIQAVLDRAEQRRHHRAAVIVTDRIRRVGRTYGQLLLSAVSRLDKLCVADESDGAGRRLYEEFMTTAALADQFQVELSREVSDGSLALASSGLHDLHARALHLGELADKLAICIKGTPHEESSFKFLWAVGGPWAVWNQLRRGFVEFDREASAELHEQESEREWELGRSGLMMWPPWPDWKRDQRLMTWLRAQQIATGPVPMEADVGHIGEELNLGFLLMQDPQREEQAEEVLRHVMDSGHPQCAPRAAAALGALLDRQGRKDEAKAALRCALESDDEEGVPVAKAALGCLLADQPEEQGDAEGLLREAIASGHQTATAHALSGLSELLVRLGRADEAEEALNEAIAADGEHVAIAWGELGGLLIGQPGRKAEGEAALLQAIASEHEDAAPRAAFTLAVLLLEEPDREKEAKHLLRQASESDHPYAAPEARAILNRLNKPPSAWTGQP